MAFVSGSGYSFRYISNHLKCHLFDISRVQVWFGCFSKICLLIFFKRKENLRYAKTLPGKLIAGKEVGVGVTTALEFTSLPLK